MTRITLDERHRGDFTNEKVDMSEWKNKTTPKPKTREEILALLHPSPDNYQDGDRNIWINSYKTAESGLLPIIQKQAEEIERLKVECEAMRSIEDFYKTAMAKIAEVIGISSPTILIAMSKKGETYADTLTRLVKKSKDDAVTLRTKFNGLVKDLRLLSLRGAEKRMVQSILTKYTD